MRKPLILIAAFIVIGILSFTNKSGLKITSPAFTENGMIPAKYSCEGGESSPRLHISDIPAGAKTLALILHDPDAPMAGGFTHWVLWNLDVNGDIPENFKGAEQGYNSMKQTGYKGMCPPTGTHHYHFMVYALDTKLELNKSTDKAGLEKAMQGHILATGDLVGLYKKQK